MPPLNRLTCLSAVVLCAILIGGVGCQKPPRKSILDQVEKNTGKKLNTSPAELRLKIQHAALPLSGIIEAYGDRILEDCNDPSVRKNALLWKINGIPTIHQAIFQSDPFLAFLDMWVLAVQMRLFFEEGLGREALGKWHPIAVEGTQKLESILRTMARKISADGDITTAEEKINTWGQENPIESMHFIRTTLTVYMASELGAETMGTFAVVDAVAIGVADLSQQMNAYANYLPKQARWQTELLLEGLTATEKIDQALAGFGRMSRDIERLTLLAESTPARVSAERTIILKALTRNLDRALAALEKERVAVMTDFKNERAGISADITAERIALLAEIDRQRRETLADMEGMSRRMLEEALEDSNAKIDYFFIRTLQVGGLLVLVVLCFCAAAIYYIHGRPRQT